MVQGFRKLDELLAKIIRDAGLSGIVDEDFREWALFALREIGAYSQFERKTAKLEVENYVALLPEDFYQVDEQDFIKDYKLQLNGIITNQKSGYLVLPYLAFATEEDERTGEVSLLIPDESTYEEAITWYIYSKLCLQDLFPNKQITYPYANERWVNLKIAARAEANMPSRSQMKRTANNNMNPRHGFGTNGWTWNRK